MTPRAPQHASGGASSDAGHDASGAEADGIVSITYYTDPLCIWSWAFEPQWRRLRYEYSGKLRWRYRMGGMIRSWRAYQDPMNEVSRPLHLGPLSQQASEISGMPIASRVWADDPPGSSYPACVAVKASELQGGAASEHYLRRLREALLLHGRNIARREVLLAEGERLAEERPELFDACRFARDLDGEAAVAAFREDLRLGQEREIGRFPTLTFEAPGKTPRMIVGYRPYEVLLQAFEQMAPGEGARRNVGDIDAYESYWGALVPREAEEAQAGARTQTAPATL